MGGNQSKSDTASTIGNMKLYLAKSEYIPGEVISGNVILNVTTDDIYCDTIVIKFKASEQMTYKGTTQKPLAVIDRVAQIIPVRRKLSRGACTFQFTYELPQQLQPSTYVNGSLLDSQMEQKESEHDITFTLMYLMTAEMEIKSKEILDLQAVNVMKIATAQNNQPIGESFQARLSGCLGGDYGVYRQRISIPRSEFNPGESIPITLNVDNTGKLTLQKMEIQIKRDSTLINQKQIGKMKTKFIATKSVQLGVLGRTQKTNIKETINIPKDKQIVLPTFQGGCFDCRYSIQFTFIFNTPFCSTVKSVQSVPLTIISDNDRKVINSSRIN